MPKPGLAQAQGRSKARPSPSQSWPKPCPGMACQSSHLGWIAARAHTGLIGPIGPPRKIGKFCAFFAIFRSMEKITSDGPKWGQDVFFPTNPDLADILGRTDLNFEKFYFFDFLNPKFPDAAAGRTLRSQLDPSPNAPRNQIRRKGPRCDMLP